MAVSKKKCTSRQKIVGVHGKKVYIRTLFHNAHHDIETILIFVNAYVHECFSYDFVKSELKICDQGICDWASFFGEVLIEWCCKRDGQIGGIGKIVEIDESRIGKKKT